jgi:hypothetical protein
MGDPDPRSILDCYGLHVALWLKKCSAMSRCRDNDFRELTRWGQQRIWVGGDGGRVSYLPGVGNRWVSDILLFSNFKHKIQNKDGKKW